MVSIFNSSASLIFPKILALHLTLFFGPSPFADLVVTHALEWPSLTVQWLPNKEQRTDSGVNRQQLVLGTHTSEGEQNYLMRAQVELPLEDTETDNR